MARTMRGCGGSRNIAVPMIAPSKGSWPEWLEMRRTRPVVGTWSMPNAWTRKYERYMNRATPKICARCGRDMPN